MPAVRQRMKPVKDLTVFIKEWGPKIDKIIASMGLQDVGDDIKQDIYLHIITPDPDPDSPSYGLNGLEKYDPAVAVFSTYVYGLVLTRIRNARTKRLRELGLMPYSHDQGHGSTESTEVNERARKHDKDEAHSFELTGNVSDMSRAEFTLQVEKALEALKRYPVRSSFFRDGECITRDLHTLMRLVLEEKTREEIVEHFDYSTGSVGVMFEQLRKVPEIIQLREMLGK